MVDPFIILCRTGMMTALVSSVAAHCLVSEAGAEFAYATTICLLAAITLQAMMEKLFQQESFAKIFTGFFFSRTLFWMKQMGRSPKNTPQLKASRQKSPESRVFSTGGVRKRSVIGSAQAYQAQGSEQCGKPVLLFLARSSRTDSGWRDRPNSRLEQPDDAANQ